MSGQEPRTMAQLRALIVEDSEDDALLVLRALRQGGYEPSFIRVETAGEMEAALDRSQWDVLISDYTLPRFDGLAALQLLQERKIDLPFIIVSGTIGEDKAVAAMKAGAHDYLIKGNLSRLGPAVARELREAEIRLRHRELERTREETTARLQMLDQLKTEFITFISHELRTPLNAISAINMVGEGQLEQAEQEELIGIVRSGYERLLNLTVEALEYFDWMGRSVVGASEAVDLADLVQTAARSLHGSTGRGADLQIAVTRGPVLVSGQSKDLAKAVRILLADAGESCQEGAAIQIGIRGGADGVVLTIAGQCILSKAEPARDLFFPFTLAGRGDRPRGPKLALGLAKAIIEAHGGRIELEHSGQGREITFIVSLPTFKGSAAVARHGGFPDRQVKVEGGKRPDGSPASA